MEHFHFSSDYPACQFPREMRGGLGAVVRPVSQRCTAGMEWRMENRSVGQTWEIDNAETAEATFGNGVNWIITNTLLPSVL